MSDAMISTATAKSPKPLRMNQKAVLIPAAQYQIWYDQAVLTSGLSELDRAVLDAVAAYYRLLEQRGHASVPTIEQMAKSAQVRSIDITGAIRHLVGLALIAVRPGAGARRNEYLMCLPKRVVAVMLTAAADDDGPPF
jgi:hypothetical protein